MIVVAIDGPAGAGKSTIGRALAARLGLRYLDTGAQYRSVAVAMMRRGIDLADATTIEATAPEVQIEVLDEQLLIDGVESSAAIRTPEASQAASRVAVLPGVRRELARQQRAWASAHGGGVIEGRDIGTVVFPEANLKLFVTASADVRAKRRSIDTGENPADVLSAIRERDGRDAGREHAPLMTADGARVIDTSDRSVEDIIDEIVDLLGARR